MLERNKHHHLNKHPFHRRLLYYILAITLLVFFVMLLGSVQGIKPSFEDFFSHVHPQLLIMYSLYTLLRLLIAYVLGLFFTFTILLIILSHKKVENFFVPIFDILQSVPVLAFFPLIIIAFARFHLPELAAQIVLAAAMFWSVLFGALGGLHQIPNEIMDAAKIYGAKGFRRFRKVVLPAIFPYIITGSILSWGAGWNVIIISEYINYGSVKIRLPGLGNVLSSSAGYDMGLFTTALILLVIIILIIDRLVWQRLISISEKYKFE